ncbi:hypothetical protein [Bacillus haynesii]|uniref:hypothetical protein n=1 Tax=Bacillus haynesii TaxID=1925021 RepID=UPI0013014535|nr:hypothetical protein [Bacillus haynesii]
MNKVASEVVAGVLNEFHLATKKHKYWTDEVNVFRVGRKLETTSRYLRSGAMRLCCGR